MDSATVRAKVSEHAERLSRLTVGERRKAEAEDRAFLTESLGVGESPSVCFFLTKSERGGWVIIHLGK